MSEEKAKSTWLSLPLKNKGKDDHPDLLSLPLLVAVGPQLDEDPPSSEQEELTLSVSAQGSYAR